MCFTFESADSCLQSVQHYCKEVWQEPTVDSIDDAKACFKKVFFCCKASIAPPSASNAFPKSAAYLILFPK